MFHCKELILHMAQNWLNFTLVAGAPAAPIHPDPTLTDTVPYELSEQDQTQKEEPIPPKSPDLPTVERRLRFKQSRPPKTKDSWQNRSAIRQKRTRCEGRGRADLFEQWRWGWGRAFWVKIKILSWWCAGFKFKNTIRKSESIFGDVYGLLGCACWKATADKSAREASGPWPWPWPRRWRSRSNR